MAIQITSTYLGGRGTGVANTYDAMVRHEGDFPDGGTDPVTGLPTVKHHACERVVRNILATTLAQFVAAVKADGNAWKAEVVAELAAAKPPFSQLTIGASVTY